MAASLPQATIREVANGERRGGTCLDSSEQTIDLPVARALDVPTNCGSSTGQQNKAKKARKGTTDKRSIRIVSE
jgi:hypothetical protein